MRYTDELQITPLTWEYGEFFLYRHTYIDKDGNEKTELRLAILTYKNNEFVEAFRVSGALNYNPAESLANQKTSTEGLWIEEDIKIPIGVVINSKIEGLPDLDEAGMQDLYNQCYTPDMVLISRPVNKVNEQDLILVDHS